MKKTILLFAIQLFVIQGIISQNKDLAVIIHENAMNNMFKAIGEINGTSSYSFMFIEGAYDWTLVNPQIRLHPNKANFITDVKVQIGSYSYMAKVTGNVEVCYEPSTNIIYVEITEALFPLNIMFFGKIRHLWDVDLKKYFETPFTFEGPLTMGTEIVFDMPDNTQKKIYSYPKNCGVKVVEKEIIVTAEMDFISRENKQTIKK